MFINPTIELILIVIATFLMSEKHGSRKHYRFTYFGSSDEVVPNIVLQYTATPKQPGQKVTLSVGKSKSSSNKKAPQSGLGKVLNELVKKVSQKDVERLFAAPVTDDIAPNYSLVIKEPIDLSIIRAKVQHDEYETIQQFREDMYLMFRNCMTYNPPGSYVYREGEALLLFFRKCFKQAKNQLKGEGQTSTESVTSFARGEAGPERTSNGPRNITRVNIPVVFDEPSVESEIPKFDHGPGMFFGYVPHPPGADDHDNARFEAACEMISISADVRENLKLLSTNFPPYVLEDAVRELAGVSSAYKINMEAVTEAMSSTDDSGNCVAVGMAPIDSQSLEMLANSCPTLPLRCMRRTGYAADTLKDQNLRLVMFYNNCMRHWRKASFVAGKRKVLDAIQRNVANITLNMKPSVVVKDRSECLVIQHITYSTHERL